MRFPREARACGARPGFERLESSGIASQGIDRARDVIGAIGIEQGPSPRLLHQTGQFRKRAHSQREPGLEVFEDLVGQAEPVVHRRWPVGHHPDVESGQALHQSSGMGRRQEVHATLQPPLPHEGAERRLEIPVPAKVELGRIVPGGAQNQLLEPPIAKVDPLEDDASLARAGLTEAARLRAHGFDGERTVHHHGRQRDAVPLRHRRGDRVVDRHDLVRGTDEPMF